MAETFIVEESQHRRWRVTLTDEVISMTGEMGGEAAIRQTALDLVACPAAEEGCRTELLHAHETSKVSKEDLGKAR